MPQNAAGASIMGLTKAPITQSVTGTTLQLRLGRSNYRLQGSSAQNVDVIRRAAKNGDVIRLRGSSDSNTITLRDNQAGTNLNLRDVVRVLGANEYIDLVWNFGTSRWDELAYSGDNFATIERESQVVAADGAITIKSGTVYITKTGTLAAVTLAAPTATTDDGKRLLIMSTTNLAHTVTQTTPGFNNGSTASDVATFGTAVGNNFEIVAYQGVWYVISTRNVTLG